MNAQLAARIAGQTPREIQALDGQAGPAWLGVMVNDLTDSFRAQFGISVFRGAAITNVAPASPASKAGLQAGDAIIEVSGRPIDTAQALLSWMTTKRPGDAVQLVVYRGINARTVTVVLERNPESVPPIRPDQSFPRPSVALPPAVTNPTVELPARVDGELELTPPTPAVISAADVQSLQREIVRLKEELQLANQRLQQTQQELQAVLSGSDLPE
jgi:membrane-associated protease RseP (regulator of RpoE activity)